MTWRLICCVGAGLLASPGQAQVSRPIGTAIGRPLQTAAAPAPMLSETELGANRAGQAAVAANQTLKATTTGNTVNGNLVAGPITLSGNALSKFSGVGNFAINSGSQVSIQSGMNLTVNVTK